MLSVRTIAWTASRVASRPSAFAPTIPATALRTAVVLRNPRNFSSSPRSRAVPHEPAPEKAAPSMEPHHVKSPGIESALVGPAASSHHAVDPYKDGASALDKAMNLFLLTELFRGKHMAEYCPKSR